VFTATLTRSAISEQPTTSTTTATQTLLILNTSTSTTVLEKISKSDFLADVYLRSFIPGMIVPYGSGTAPAGFLLCNGASINRIIYSDLFAAIGTNYGSASPTTFNVPNITNITAIGGYAVYYIIKT
jgi:hypothetical protein